MKVLVAIVSPPEAEAVCKAVHRAGYGDIVMSDVRVYRPGLRPDEVYKGVRYAGDTAQAVKLEVWAHDELVDQTAALIIDAALIDYVDVLPMDRATRVKAAQGSQAPQPASKPAAPTSVRAVMSM